MADERTLFTWLHLSDIHMGHGKGAHRAQQKLVLGAIADDLQGCKGAVVPDPDAVLITGDIGFSGGGREDEYRNAREWLGDICRILGLSAGDVYSVPGNHDVKRVKGLGPVATLVETLRGGREIDEIFQETSSGPTDHLYSRFEEYRKFQNGFASVGGWPSWSRELDGQGGVKVKLIGLNTALLCNDDKDKGALQVGSSQCEWLARKSDSEIRIVMSHHPLSQKWVKDEETTLSQVRTNADIYLCGHIHKAESAGTDSAGTRLVTVVGGAVHADAAKPGQAPVAHRYNVASLMATAEGELFVRVWHRKYTRKGGFKPDSDLNKNNELFDEHRLNRTVPESAREARNPEDDDPIPDDVSHKTLDAPPHGAEDLISETRRNINRELDEPPNLFAIHRKRIERVSPRPATLLAEQDPPRELVIAAVSMRAFTREELETRPLFPGVRPNAETPPKSRRRLLVRMKEEVASRARSVYLRALECARSANAHITCFNELAVPTLSDPIRPCPEIIQACRVDADANDAFTVYGTSHEEESLHNTARVFFPLQEEGDECLHYKRISARRVAGVTKEVSVPSRREQFYYKAWGLKIGVLICRDLLDFSAVAGLVPRCHLLLVPCYAAPPAMARLSEMACVISKAMKGAVVLVNRFVKAEKDEEETSVDPSIAYFRGEVLNAKIVSSSSSTYRVRAYSLVPAKLMADKEPENRLDDAGHYQWLFESELRKAD